MVITCAAPSCSAKKVSVNSKTSVLFHRFPLRKPDVLAKWVKAMKQTNFKPTVKTYLCGAHFTANDYEIKTSSGEKQLKPNAVPTVFEKRRPGRKKKLLSENEVSDEIKDTEDKNEAEETVEEYLESNLSDKEEANLADLIGNQEKETLQILIVGEDGKITNSEYIYKKELFSDEDLLSRSDRGEIRDPDTDEDNGSHSKKHAEEMDSNLLEKTLGNYKELRSQEKIKMLETNLVSTKKKVKVLQLKCKKMNKKLNRLKILLKLLVLKRGRGEKNLKELLEGYEKELNFTKVQVKEEESCDF